MELELVTFVSSGCIVCVWSVFVFGFVSFINIVTCILCSASKFYRRFGGPGALLDGSNSRLRRDSNPEKGVPLHTIKSYMVRKGVAPLIHILGTRCRYRGRGSVYIRSWK